MHPTCIRTTVKNCSKRKKRSTSIREWVLLLCLAYISTSLFFPGNLSISSARSVSSLRGLKLVIIGSASFCLFQVSFCSSECFKRADHRFHWADCGLLQHLQGDQELGSMALLAFRILIRAGYEKIAEAISRDEKEVEKGARYDSTEYACVFAQETNIRGREHGEMFRRCVTALYLTHFLRQTGEFFPKVTSSEEEEDRISSEALVRHLLSCSCNAYEVSEMRGGCVSVELGGSVYPTVSLTNHACWPNTMRYSSRDGCVLRASRTINKGEEITDNYGEFYQMTPKEERAKRSGWF